jgi:hypothetical protein
MGIEQKLFANSRAEVAGQPGQRSDIKPVLQRVFLSEDGKALLRYLLYDWGYFSICATPEQQAMRNYAAKFLNELGNGFDIEVIMKINVGDAGAPRDK